MFDEMKCPVCGSTNYEIIDSETEADFDSSPSITWMCFCPECNSNFDIYAKMKYTSIEYLNVLKNES